MLANPLRSADIAWPTELVFATDRSTIIGCRMPLAAGMHPIPAVFSNDPTTRWLCADYAFRLRLAINLAKAVDSVHQHRCVVCDFSHANTLVGKDASVCLIYTDSFQVTGRDGRIYRCDVGAADLTPAELHGVNFADVDRTVFHDSFAL